MKYNSQATVICMHIPKTAGTSLRTIAQRFYTEEEMYMVYGTADDYHDPADFLALSDFAKAKIRFICGHIPFGFHRLVLNPCVYITMLRDPVEQMISMFTHFSQNENHYHYSRIRSNKLSIGDFIRSEITTETDNLQTRMLSGRLEKPGRTTAEMLEIAKRNLAEHFPVYGLTEYFEESILRIRDSLGWRLHHSSPGRTFDQESPFHERANVSIDRPKTEALSQDDMDAIMSYSELDRQLYTYAEKLFLQKNQLIAKVV